MQSNVKSQNRLSWLSILTLLVMLAATIMPATTQAQGGSPVLALSHTVSQEPLLSGQVAFTLNVRNNGATAVTDRGYNLTITDTLPVGLTYVSADPAPTNVARQSDGATTLTWDNIADLEANESLDIGIVATLASTVTVADDLVNRAGVKVNTMPDNSGAWVTAFSELSTRPQAIDIETSIIQSTAEEQAMGAGEYASAPGRGAGADWPFLVRVSVRNNNVGTTNNVVARITLPPGVAYLGNVGFSTNPNSVATTPVLALKSNGALDLSWALGNLTTAQYATPIVITFQTAIPYRFRTAADTTAAASPFAGPMGGEIIAEDTVMEVLYEATGVYANAPTADGSEATPDDDAPARTTAEIMTVDKNAAPTTVGIGTEVTFSLTYYVSEYYTVTNASLVDVLPDGMTYVDGSANLAPVSVTPGTPGAGQSTIIWALPAEVTTPGASATVTFRALVDATYEAAPLTGQPIVSGDSLTNRVTLSGDWADAVTADRLSALTPDTSSATVSTRMPSFNKVVFNPVTQQWGASTDAYTGDTVTFRLTYASAADIDAKNIIIRDFLPRGMTYIDGSATHTTNGTFSNGASCTAAPQAPTLGTLGGLQYLEWRLCNAAAGATWEAQIQARVGPEPNVQPGWIVANFGKLSGANSFGQNYSLRAMAITNYKAPRLVLTKTATPSSNLQAGSVVTYRISVLNAGEATAYNLSVIDTVPASLLISNSGGSGAPSAATYTATSGDPASGAGGVLTWSTVASLAPGQTQTFTYQATVGNNPPLTPGAALNNLASVAYNSRSDNQGHAVAHSANIDDDQTDDITVYIKNLTIIKTGVRVGGEGATEQVTIGDTMRWTLTVTVPTGVIAYWPVVEENDLPSGFNYLAGTRTIAGATFDDANHAANPKISTNPTDLRFYLNTVDNTAGLTPYVFTLGFDTIVTGVRADQPTTVYYTNNTVLNDAINTTYIGWYDDATGYNGSGYAYDGGFETNRIDRRSPRGRFTAKVRQPYLTIQKVASNNRIGAGDIINYTVVVRNTSYATAYDMKLRDSLPADLTLLGIDSIQKPDNTNVTPMGQTSLSYTFWIDRLDAGASVTIVYRAQVNANVPSDSSLTNTASIESFSTQPGSATVERSYTGPRTTASVHTPQGSIRKSVTANELTYGGTLVYTLTVPGEPINATMFNVLVTDTVDSRFEILGVVNGAVADNVVTAAFASIPPNTQQQIAITVRLPESSVVAANFVDTTPVEFRDLLLMQTAGVGAATVVDPVAPGTLLYNRGYVHYEKGGLKGSNTVSNRIVTPALVVEHQAAQIEAAAGTLVDYTVKVHNVGNGYAENLLLDVTLPANLQFEAGTALLDGAPFAIGGLTGVALPSLPGESSHTLTFQARVLTIEAGVGYQSTAHAVGADSRGQAIPVDNSARIPEDIDPDDTATTLIFGPLEWDSASTYVAYEDLKNVGWSDWDYNDFIVKIGVARGKTSDGSLAALRLDYEAMARGASYNHRFLHGLPIYGGGSYALVVRNADAQVLSTTSGDFATDEPAFAVFERTQQALPFQSAITDNRYKLFTNTAPVQTWVQKGYTAQLQIVLTDPTQNLVDALPPLPWDPYLEVINTNQAIHLVQPGYTGNTQVVNSNWDPNSPLIGFDLPLAYVFDARWKWPQEFLGIWNVYPDYVQYELSDGFVNHSWWDPTVATTHMEYAWLGGAIANVLAAQAQANPSRYYAAPVVADLDGDGAPEIIVGNLVKWQVEVYNSNGRMRSGWPQILRSGVKSAAAVGDLNGDGTLEVVVGDLRGYLHAFNADGTRLAGWSSQGLKTGDNPDAEYRILAQPLVVDLDQNGTREILLTLSDSKLYVYEANGALRAGWPVSLGNAPDIYGSHVVDSAPVVADIDGDGQLEIVVGSYDHNLYVYNADGSLAWKYETRDVIMGAAAVGDVASGSPGLEIVIGSGDRFVYLLSSDGQLLWKRATGWIVRSSPLLVDIDGDGALEIFIGSDDKKVWAWRNNGDRVTGWPQLTGAAVSSSPIAGDVDNDGQLELIVGSDDGFVYAWNADGTLAEGWPKEAGYPIKSAPALLNADIDADIEVVATTYEGTLKILGGPIPLYMPIIRRK